MNKIFSEAGTRVDVYVSADNHAAVLAAALKYNFGPKNGHLEDFAQARESFEKGQTVPFERRVSMEEAAIAIYKGLSKMLPLRNICVTAISHDP